MEWTYGLVGAAAALSVLAPLAWKWALPKWPVIGWATGVGAASGLWWRALLGDVSTWLWLLAHLFTVLAVSGAAAAAAFYRDPERASPGTDRAVVSPADGQVLYVRPFRRGEVPPVEKKGRPLALAELAAVDICERGYLIGIGMHLLNVHVNRAPIGGRVTGLIHIPGGFFSLKRKGATTANERLTTVIENERTQVAVVQIASRLVRRIVSYVEAGTDVSLGQRIGMIRFGSQVDVIVPESDGLHIAVRTGDRVRAGVSVLGHLGEEGADRAI